MDGGSFDRLARGVGRQATRRTALVTLAGALVGVGSARSTLAQAAEVGAERRCGGLDDRCERGRGGCCQGLRCNNRRGRCEWKNNHGRREGDWCERNRDCKRRRNLECDRRRNECVQICVEIGDTCRRDTDCCDIALCDNRRCCGARGNQCSTSRDCCLGLKCSNGICRN